MPVHNIAEIFAKGLVGAHDPILLINHSYIAGYPIKKDLVLLLPASCSGEIAGHFKHELDRSVGCAPKRRRMAYIVRLLAAMIHSDRFGHNHLSFRKHLGGRAIVAGPIQFLIDHVAFLSAPIAKMTLKRAVGLHHVKVAVNDGEIERNRLK